MDDTKVKPWKDYNYMAKLPDFWEVSGMVSGLYICKALYMSKKRPIRTPSGYATCGMYVLGGYLIGKAITKIRNDYLRRRQVFIEHYMDSHPEDFATSEPQKFKDVLWKWDPIR